MMTMAEAKWAMLVLAAVCLIPVFQAWRESRRRWRIMRALARGKWSNERGKWSNEP